MDVPSGYYFVDDADGGRLVKKPTLTIAAKWEEFAACVMPPDAPPVQRQEMKRAFYGGVFIMLNAIKDDIGDDSCSEDEGVARLQRLNEECIAFYADVKTGRA